MTKRKILYHNLREAFASMADRIRRIAFFAIALTMIFAVVGCGGGLNGDSAPTRVIASAEQTKAAETRATETKKGETKAAETKAAETKKVETKAAETKATETKAAETKAAETKASQTSAAETEASSVTVTEDGEYTSKEEVALYLHLFGHLPHNYITKEEAQELGWKSSKGNLWKVAPNASIGGSRFGNYEKKLPTSKGRKYYECDVNYDGGFRGAERIIYSNDGLVFYTADHYKTFEQLY